MYSKPIKTATHNTNGVLKSNKKLKLPLLYLTVFIQIIIVKQNLHLKGQSHEISVFRFYHQTAPLGPIRNDSLVSRKQGVRRKKLSNEFFKNMNQRCLYSK